jgi:hypothetical protein
LIGLSTVEIPTTILASAGTPIATEVPKTVWTTTTHDFFGEIFGKLFRTAKSSWTQKEEKSPIFCLKDFGQSDSEQNIGSLMLLVR